MTPELMRKRISDNIKKFRLLKKMSKKMVAERIKMNYSTYCRIENNKIKNPKLYQIILIAESLGENFDELFIEQKMLIKH